MTALVKACGKRIGSRAIIAAIFITAINAVSVAAPETLIVLLDQAKLVKLPERVATVIVGNPLIADVSLQAGGMIVVTGKGYGVTNVVALDRSGATLMEKSVQVEGPRENHVVLYRGIERETYSCTPVCERRITLGDTQTYFGNALAQTGAWTAMALGASQAASQR